MKGLRYRLLTLFCAGGMSVGACHAEDITVRFDGSQAKVTQTKKDSVSVTVDGASVNIVSLYESYKLTLTLKGRSDNGQLVLKTNGYEKTFTLKENFTTVR